MFETMQRKQSYAFNLLVDGCYFIVQAVLCSGQSVHCIYIISLVYHFENYLVT